MEFVATAEVISKSNGVLVILTGYNYEVTDVTAEDVTYKEPKTEELVFRVWSEVSDHLREVVWAYQDDD